MEEELEFHEVQRDLNRADFFYTAMVMKNTWKWSITGREPFLMIVTDTDIYYGGNVKKPNKFFRIDLRKLEYARVVGRGMFKSIEIKFRNKGTSNIYICPFAISNSRIIADKEELYKLRNVIHNSIESADNIESEKNMGV